MGFLYLFIILASMVLSIVAFNMIAGPFWASVWLLLLLITLLNTFKFRKG